MVKSASKDSLLFHFLNDSENEKKYKSYIRHPTKENKDDLEFAFKGFVFKIRFAVYISKTIHGLSLNYDQKENKFLERNQLILDKPLESGGTMSDLLLVTPYNNLDSEHHLLDMITNDALAIAISQLNDYQKLILEYSYLYELKDTEIAKLLGKSQQSVSQAKKRALNKVRELMERGPINDSNRQ